MITNNDLVRIKAREMKEALKYGEENAEMEHNNPMTGILRAAGKRILEQRYGGTNAEPLILRLTTTQVIGRKLYVPTAFLKDGNKKIVAIYVHMPKSRLATIDSIKGITIAGWAEAWDLRSLHTKGESMICVKNENVLEPMRTLNKQKEKP